MENPNVTNSPPFSSASFDANRFRKIGVFILTTGGVFSGYTFCQHQQRLLDALNKGFFTTKLQTSSDFMPLFDLEVFSPGSKVSHMDTIYIRKSSILLVGEGELDKPPGSTNSYPLRRKKTINAIVNLPQVNLTGNMYSELWEELQDALNRSDQFIPVTDASFEPSLPGGIKHANFVAINKDHVIYVGK
jgi:hypothetical protein